VGSFAVTVLDANSFDMPFATDAGSIKLGGFFDDVTRKERSVGMARTHFEGWVYSGVVNGPAIG
jgi:hypothetical protein